jgi:molybdate transport system permease protein
MSTEQYPGAGEGLLAAWQPTSGIRDAATPRSAVWLTVRLATVTTAAPVHGTPIAWWLAHRSWKGAVGAGGAAHRAAANGDRLLPAGGDGAGGAGRPADAVAGAGRAAFHLRRPGGCLGVLFPALRGASDPAFEAIGERPLEAAATLRASPLDTFFSVVLPLARPGYLTAIVLGFAHTVGEFGVVLMIGGNIPDQTRVVSVQIYDHVEALEYAQAHWLAAGMVAFSFVVLLLLYTLNPTGRRA